MLVLAGAACTFTAARDGAAILAFATAAYRTDLAAHGRPFGANDGEWITVAILAEQAAYGAADPATRLASAAAEAARALGDAQLARLAWDEWEGKPEPLDAITLLTVVMQEAGARALAGAILDSALAVVRDRADRVAARMIAQRARIAYVSAELEAAQDLYRQVDAIGTALGDAGLRARAALGLGAVAHVRGNYPEQDTFARQAVRLATEAGLGRLQRRAHYALMLSASVGGRFDEALQHGWAMFELSTDEGRDRATALQSIGQLLLERGDRVTARAAFAAVLAEPHSARVILAALGGFALTSALDASQRADLEWAVREVERFRDSAAPPYSYATALLECATALRDAGRPRDAERLRVELVSIARAHGFNELAYRGEDLRAEPARTAGVEPSAEDASRASPRSAEIIASVRELAPARLPAHVRLAAAPV